MDKYYFVGSNYSELPQTNRLEMELYVADHDFTVMILPSGIRELCMR